MLQAGQRLLEARHGRVPQPLVDRGLALLAGPAARHPLVGRPARLDVGQRVGARQVDRRHVHAQSGQIGTSCVHSPGFHGESLDIHGHIVQILRQKIKMTEAFSGTPGESGRGTSYPVPVPKNPRDVKPLDPTDLALVRLLEQDGRMSNAMLAREVGIAESTCLVRVRSLRERGVVRGIHADIDPVAVGRPVDAMIAVRFGGHRRSLGVEVGLHQLRLHAGDVVGGLLDAALGVVDLLLAREDVVARRRGRGRGRPGGSSVRSS